MNVPVVDRRKRMRDILGEGANVMPVVTPDGWFSSSRLVAEHYGCTPSTVSRRIKAGVLGWKYADPECAIGQHEGASSLGRSNETKPRKLKARQLSFDFDPPVVDGESR